MSRLSGRALRYASAVLVVVGVPALVYVLFGAPEPDLPSRWADARLPAGYVVDIVAGLLLLAWMAGLGLLIAMLVRRGRTGDDAGTGTTAMSDLESAGGAASPYMESGFESAGGAASPYMESGFESAGGAASPYAESGAAVGAPGFEPALTADAPETPSGGTPDFESGAAGDAESDEPWYRRGPPIFDEPFRDEPPRVIVPPDESVWPGGAIADGAGSADETPAAPVADPGIADAEIVGEPVAASADDPPMIVPVRAYYFTRAEDTLRSIAAQFLQTPKRWEELRSLNAASPGVSSMGPDTLLPVGTALALPGDPLPWGKPDPVYLWTLAEKFLFTAWGREPTPEEVVPFWRGLTSGQQLESGTPAAPPLHLAGPLAEVPAATTIPAPDGEGAHTPTIPVPPDTDPSTVQDGAPPPAPPEPVPGPPAVDEPVPVYEAVEPVPEQPVVEEPVLEEPVLEEPVVEEPVLEEPVPVYEAVEPVPEQPVVEEPVPEPVVEEPVVEEPVLEEPVPVYEAVEPVPEQPVVEEPVPEPVLEEPVLEEPVVEEPVLEEPVPVYEAVEPVPVPVVEEPVVEAVPVYEVVEPVPEPVLEEPVPVYEVVEPVPEPVLEEPVPVYEVVEPVPEPVLEAVPVYEAPVPEAVPPVVEAVPVYEAPEPEAVPVYELPEPAPPAAYGAPPVPATHEPAPAPGMPDLGPIEPETPRVEAEAPPMPTFMPSLTGADGAAPAAEARAVAAANRSLAGTAIGDAMMLFQISRLRRRRGAAAEPAPIEESLQQSARVDTLNLIEAAMRHLRAVTVGRLREKPAVLAVRVGTYGFEVLLSRPVGAPEGWQSASQGHVLELQPEVTIEDLHAVGHGPSLCPALVPVGDTLEGPLMLNIEEIGCLIVSGPGTPSVNLLNAVVGALGSSPLAGDIRIITVGMDVPSGIVGWERVHPTSFDSPELEGLLNTAQAGGGTLLDVLVVGPGNDLLIQRAGQTAATAGTRLAVVGATSSVAARWPWRIHVDETTTAVVHPIACTMVAAQVTGPTMTQLLTGVPGPAQPAPPGF